MVQAKKIFHQVQLSELWNIGILHAQPLVADAAFFIAIQCMNELRG